MYDLVLVDQVVKSNPEKFERAFALRTNIRIGVAVKKGNEELVKAVKEAVKEAVREAQDAQDVKEAKSQA